MRPAVGNRLRLGPIAVVGAIGATLLVTVLLFPGGRESPYTVTARFANASQLVVGNEVVVAGTPVGAVEGIELAADGEALVTFTVDDAHAPLHRGTVATVRSYSLAGIANRLVELSLPSEAAAGEEIPAGGELSQAETVAEVDLDAVFNTLDERTVGNLKRTIGGLERSFEGSAQRANRGLKYLNPLLSSSRRTLAELDRDRRALEHLIVDSSRLSGALAERSADVSGLVHNLSLTTQALASERAAVTRSVDELPDFMRRFNTTAVNLRAALDDVDPLVDASKPVATRLGPFLDELRAGSADLVPATRDLDALIRRRGRRNDLVEAIRLQVPLEEIAVGPVRRNGERRDGALPETSRALEGSLATVSFLRAYTPELLGWLNDFGTSGTGSAVGGLGRIAGTFNTYSAFTPGYPNIFGPPDTPEEQFEALDVGNDRRCPGSLERDPGDGSIPFTDGGTLDCDPTQLPVGP